MSAGPTGSKVAPRCILSTTPPRGGFAGARNHAAPPRGPPGVVEDVLQRAGTLEAPRGEVLLRASMRGSDTPGPRVLGTRKLGPGYKGAGYTQGAARVSPGPQGSQAPPGPKQSPRSGHSRGQG